MKRIITFTIAIFLIAGTTGSLSAQGRNMPETIIKVKDRMDPASIAGIHLYDTDNMMKILKIRKAAKKREVSAILAGYNGRMGGLKDENMGLLVDLGTSVKDIIQNKEFMSLWTSRTDYRDKVFEIKREHEAHHASLESELAEVLTKRQRRKWYNHQEALRKIDTESFDVGDLLSFVGLSSR